MLQANGLRMLRTLERRFPDTTAVDDDDDEGRRHWRVPSSALREQLSLTPEELAALDIAIEAVRRPGLQVEADELSGLREKILELVPRSKVAGLEADHEVLLEAQGLAARSGPRQRIDRIVAVIVAEAIKATRMLDITYRS